MQGLIHCLYGWKVLIRKLGLWVLEITQGPGLQSHSLYMTWSPSALDAPPSTSPPCINVIPQISLCLTCYKSYLASYGAATCNHHYMHGGPLSGHSFSCMLAMCSSYAHCTALPNTTQAINDHVGAKFLSVRACMGQRRRECSWNHSGNTQWHQHYYYVIVCRVGGKHKLC